MDERLNRQLAFALEIDKEKNVFRQTHLSGHGRRENDAEHAWHMAVMAYLLREYANAPVDITKVLMMCLIHDVVEIEAGDTYAYDTENLQTQKMREDAAKEKIFSMLPEDQKQELTALFDEFEEGRTAEAHFAQAMDNLQPLLLNHSNDGADWKEHRVSAAQVYGRQERTKPGSERLYEVTDRILQEHIRRGSFTEPGADGRQPSDVLLEKIRNHIPRKTGLEKAKVSAVCIPLIIGKDGEKSVLFEVRSADLPEQPGDICLPGGMLEAGETPRQAALRELSEELLLDTEEAELLGDGDVLYNGSVIIHTFVVRIPDRAYSGDEEVAEVFTVPLSFFFENEPEVYYVERSASPGEDFPFDRIRGGRDYQWRTVKSPTYFYQWADRTIWGITAKIMRDFAAMLS